MRLRNAPYWGALVGLGLLTILMLIVAYQVPARATLRTDGLGDQWFVRSSEALGQAATDAGTVFPDELDVIGDRFRWTRGHVTIRVPAWGSNRAHQATFDVEGWGDDILRSDIKQPIVHVLADGQPVGTFTPTSKRATYSVAIPQTNHADININLILSTDQTIPSLDQTAIFTATKQYPNERRPLGLRLYGFSIRDVGGGLTLPPWSILLRTAVIVMLIALAKPRMRRFWLIVALTLAFFFVLIAAFARMWMLPAVQIAMIAAMLHGLWWWRHEIGRFLATWRDRAISSGAVRYGLIAASLLFLYIYASVRGLPIISELLQNVRKLDPNAIIAFSMLVLGIMWVGLRWHDLNVVLDRINRRLRTRPRWSAIITSLIVLIWLGFGFWVIRWLPYLGNADYSDNGVVARNLVNGRGWVVDYVTQFYRLYPEGSVTRVQETWPLLPPVWIAPFFKLFGATAWAAKLPNLIFFALLSFLVYRIASDHWDRRVAIVAVLLVLINRHMFRLMMYSTSDLGFVVFYVAALWLLWRGFERNNRLMPSTSSGSGSFPEPVEGKLHNTFLIASGILIGIMCWQKTSAVVVAFGMALWLIWRMIETKHWQIKRLMLYWIVPAAIVFMPFIMRNMLEFGKPVFSTESYDAWVISYTDFDQIYRIYTDEQGLPGTGGLPDPSWVKRWGYQRTIDKVITQFEAARNYLLPDSPALGWFSGRGNLMGSINNTGSDQNPPKTWLMTGALLAFLGVFTLRRSQARLMQLVMFSFVPYIVFLAFYWHADEERYFVPLIPFLAILAGAALWSIHDQIAAFANHRARPLAMIVIGTLLVFALQPGWIEAKNKTSDGAGSEYIEWNADLQAFAWLKANTPPDAVVMTRVPWQLNFHAERPAVMNPNVADLDVVLKIARYYNAKYLLVNAVQNNKGDSRIALGDLLQGNEIRGFKKVAEFAAPKNRTIYIYAFPSDYNGQ